jgi:hypothetical protein
LDNMQFDSIVIGAGMAGLCCAGELVLQGKRPLLICETKEVGAVFAVETLKEKNTAFVQHIVWQNGWGGGWWYQLARDLNVPLRLHHGLDFEIRIQGTDQKAATPLAVSAAALTDVITGAFPFPDAARQNLERVLGAALAIPYQQLVEMHDIHLATWLTEQGADDMVAAAILALCGQTNDLTVDLAREHLSVFGGLGVLRILMCGEGSLPICYPDIRAGLCIPMAKAIEQRGGAVWRGRKAAQVMVEAGKAVGVRLQDGTEVRAAQIAIAAGNPRIPALLDPLPPEIVNVLNYTSGIDMMDFNQFYLLDREVVSARQERKVTCTFDPVTMSVAQIHTVISGAAPWTVEPGKQLVLGHTALLPEDVEKLGGIDAVYARMLERSDDQYPGLKDALEATARMEHRHHWFNPICVGPKLPRTVASVAGLWFVGDGSRPCAGIWTEAAASCGILGARAMVEAARHR